MTASKPILGRLISVFLKPLMVVVCCLSLLACTDFKDSERAVKLLQADGEMTALSFENTQQRWRVVNIWAEWCKPCWQEIPELNQFFAEHKQTDVELLGFNFDEVTSEELRRLQSEMSIDFPILNVWPKHWTQPEIMGLPATVILSPDDVIVSILWGEQTVSSLQQGIAEAKDIFTLKASGR